MLVVERQSGVSGSNAFESSVRRKCHVFCDFQSGAAQLLSSQSPDFGNFFSSSSSSLHLDEPPLRPTIIITDWHNEGCPAHSQFGPGYHLNRPSLSHRALSSTPSARASRAESLAKAAEASATASERLSAGGPPLAGPSYAARQQANNLGRSQQLLSEPSDSNAQLRLSSSQARRSRAARFGTSRHVAYAPPTSLQSSTDQLARSTSEGDDDEAALAYAAPAGTSTSSIYLPEYVAWAISQLIAAANDPKLLRADHLKLAHLTDPQEHLAEAAHIPPKRSSLLHLATVSPQRYAAILAVFSEVRQRLSHRGPVQEADADLDAVLPTWTPQTVLDFDCAAGEGLWAAAQIFRQDDADPHSPTSLQHYHGFDRRPNLLKSGKKVAQASASNASPADIKPAARDVKLKDEGERSLSMA